MKRQGYVSPDVESKITPSHVLIGGVVFPWHEKEPYVTSGRSVLGALEYNAEHNLIKCHICGAWLRSLGTHLAMRDGVSAREYRRDFGLRSTTSLSVPSATTNRQKAFRERADATGTVTRLVRARRARTEHKAPPVRGGINAETRNLKSLCFAQIRARVVGIALELDGTPRRTELARAGIPPSTILATYDLPLGAFLKTLGLTPNRSGGARSREPLPAGFRRKYAREVAA